MKKKLLGVVIALAGYVIGCKISYDIGYERRHKKGILDYNSGWKAATYVNREIYESKKEETTDKEKSE